MTSRSDYMREYRKRKKGVALHPTQRLRVLVLVDDKVIIDSDTTVHEWKINFETPFYESGESDVMRTYRRTGWRHLTLDYLTVPERCARMENQ